MFLRHQTRKKVLPDDGSRMSCENSQSTAVRTKVTFCSRIPGSRNTFLAEYIKALILAICLFAVVSVSHVSCSNLLTIFVSVILRGYPCSIVMFKRYR